MIKYDVVKDSRIEVVHHGTIPHYTTQELLEYADNRSAYYYDRATGKQLFKAEMLPDGRVIFP